MKKFLIILFLVIIFMGVYIFFINTTGFKIVEDAIAIQDLPESFEDFKIVQFSDFLIGSTKNVDDIENVVKEINNLEPDLIVFTGDLIASDYSVSEDEVNIAIVVNPIVFNGVGETIFKDCVCHLSF